MSVSICADRLLLRQWRDEDRQLFAAINADPLVMQFFPRHYTQVESDAFIDDNAHRLATAGWGAWAVETLEHREFMGFVGFTLPATWHPCAGSIDIGWRLSREHWGQGYATEAANAALRYGFESADFDEVVSYTAQCNARSLAVMRKIGMQMDPHGFEHPRIDADSHLRRHILYRLSRDDWRRYCKGKSRSQPR